jgi:hypothetical protein
MKPSKTPISPWSSPQSEKILPINAASEKRVSMRNLTSKSALFEELTTLQQIADECVEQLTTLVDEGLLPEASLDDLML